MYMWSAFSFIHEKSYEKEIFSIRLPEEQSTSSAFSHLNPFIPLQEVQYQAKSAESKFLGTSADWCILSVRSLVRLISELSIHGEHPGIYGLAISHCIYTTMTSLLIEIPPINRDHTTFNEHDIESFEYIQISHIIICIVHAVNLLISLYHTKSFIKHKITKTSLQL